jgi:hypothetical protein
MVSPDSAGLDAFTWSRYRGLRCPGDTAYADTVSDRQGASAPGDKSPVPLITDARSAASAEQDSRVKRYALTMGFRTACFVAMIFVEGPLRWVLFAGAVLLPYVAVIVANQANQRSQQRKPVGGPPIDRPQLTTGPEEAEVITGAVSDGYAQDTGRRDRDRKVA